MQTQPFSIQIPQATLDDLRDRLRRTRWPDEPTDVTWEYGTNLAYLRELITYWAEQFDWQAQEQKLNQFRHYRAEVNSLKLHFIHERGQGPSPFPLIITHGWPSTFFELTKLIPLLTDPARYGADPEDAFDVVVPSLPGYGFSDKIAYDGAWNIHDRWAGLMTGLGYERYGAQGGDIGSIVSSHLGYFYPEQVAGVHLNSAVMPQHAPNPLLALDPAVAKYGKDQADWLKEEASYKHQHSTRPQSLAYGLNDSPAGLAGWIVEKLRRWSDCRGRIEERFSKDDILTTLTIYWATETINSSMRWYYQNEHYPVHFKSGTRVEVPVGIAEFPAEFNIPPRTLLEQSYNVQHWTKMAHGGHFGAWEEPELLAEDIREFFRDLR